MIYIILKNIVRTMHIIIEDLSKENKTTKK